MIYDAFLFFNELDLLELRMEILDPYVDYFVISEATVTFSGNAKPLYFLENKDRYKKFAHKIIHVIVDHTPDSFIDTTKFLLPETADISKKDKIRNKILRNMMGYNHWDKNILHWGRDFYHRECVLIGLADCSDDDIILLSDLDEIPNPEEIKKLKGQIPENNFCHMVQRLYYYYLNCLMVGIRWYGTKVCYYSFLKDKDSNALRIFKDSGIPIENGGWHFSFIGGVEMIKKKIESYGHQELNTNDVKNMIAQNVKDNRCIVGDSYKIITVDIDSSYPEYLLKNISKYAHLVKG